MTEDTAFAANTIGIFLLMLKDKYSNVEIMKMLQRNKLKEMLKILDSRGQ